MSAAYYHPMIAKCAMAAALLLGPLLAFAPALDGADVKKLTVVSGSSIVHDLVKAIGGERINAKELIPAGVDPHTYAPKPEDAKILAAADVLVINGLGFEGWWEKLAKETALPPERVIIAATGVTTLALPQVAGHDGHDHGAEVDPHAFGDVKNAMRYAENIRDRLSVIDTAGAAYYRATSDLLIAELKALDAWAKRTLATIPAANRVVITNHDAMQYFAKAYGFTVKAPNTAFEDSEPSARQIAELIAFIRTEKVKAVFIEYAKNPKLIEQVGREAGVTLGAELFLDGVPPADHAFTGYRGMIVSNVLALVAALP